MRGKREMDFPNGRFHFPNGMRGRPMCILASRDKRGSRRRQVDTETAARENGFGKAILPEDKLWGRSSAILIRRINGNRQMDVTFEGNSAKGKNEWLTPPELLRKLGDFDLDPCSPVNRPWATAANHYTIEDDGLRQPWFGRVFCNPPYDTALIVQFIKRCVEHKDVIALTFARTETKLFQELIFKKAHSILFIKGRLSFHHVSGERSGTAGAPSCLIAFDERNGEILKNCGISGKFLLL